MTVQIADELIDVDGRVDELLWAARRAAGDPVGLCHCNGQAYAEETDMAWGRRFFTASCHNGHEAVIPATRVVRRPTTRILVGVGISDALIEASLDRDAAILGERRGD
jgi:hypothetical protein